MQALLQRAERIDPKLASFVARFDEAALGAAEEADKELAAGIDRGPLHGIPVGVKDIIATSEGPTRANSLVLDPNWAGGKDAPVVSRLRSAGAIIIGKTSTHEFALGWPDPDKPFPLPRNPWSLDCWPGGSSAGSASGVSAGLFCASIGTDTGGSLRVPASFCGVTGFVPTFGLIPSAGCIPVGFSLDRIGSIARSADDCAAVLFAMAGRSPKGSVPSTDDDLRGLRVGIVEAMRDPDGADPAVRGSLEAAIDSLRSLGVKLYNVALPYYEEVSFARRVIMLSEALAYHRRDISGKWADYSSGARSTIATGALVTSSDYVQAQRVRRLGQREISKLFNEVDVIVSPTASVGAPRYKDLNMAAVFGLVNTSYWSATGNPCLVLPMGFTDRGLPLSLQLVGRPFEEPLLGRAGAAFQRATDWHKYLPPLTGSQE